LTTLTERCRKCGHTLLSYRGKSDVPPPHNGMNPLSCYECSNCGFCHWGSTPESRTESHTRWARRLSIDFLDLYSNELHYAGEDPLVGDLYQLRSIRRSNKPTIGYCSISGSEEGNNRRVQGSECSSPEICCKYCNIRDSCSVCCVEMDDDECAFLYGEYLE